MDVAKLQEAGKPLKYIKSMARYIHSAGEDAKINMSKNKKRAKNKENTTKSNDNIQTLKMVCIECKAEEDVKGWLLEDYGTVPATMVERHPWICPVCSGLYTKKPVEKKRRKKKPVRKKGKAK